MQNRMLGYGCFRKYHNDVCFGWRPVNCLFAGPFLLGSSFGGLKRKRRADHLADFWNAGSAVGPRLDRCANRRRILRATFYRFLNGASANTKTCADQRTLVLHGVYILKAQQEATAGCITHIDSEHRLQGFPNRRSRWVTEKEGRLNSSLLDGRRPIKPFVLVQQFCDVAMLEACVEPVCCLLHGTIARHAISDAAVKGYRRPPA